MARLAPCSESVALGTVTVNGRSETGDSRGINKPPQ